MEMFFAQEKIEKLVNELEPYRYYNRAPISDWKMQFDPTKTQKYPPVAGKWEQVKVGQQWTTLDTYIWLKSEINLPQVNDGVLLFDLGLPGNLNQTGFEGLLFIDNKPYQGIDSNHKEVLIPQSLAGKRTIAIKLWTGMYGRHGNRKEGLIHKFHYADYAEINQSTDDLYFTSRNMIETVKILDQNSETAVDLLKQLTNAFQLIDWQIPGSSAFYDSCRQADEYLNNYLNTKPKDTAVNITAIGHTHIDLAWLWRIKHTREKAARSFLTVLRLMEKYPEYVFLQSTPQLYQYIKEDYPEIFTQIKQRITEGRWEIDGGMWLEADCNIPSGESLVRQIIFGTQFMIDNFGKRPHYLWLPDVFGYSWALPQILKKSGLTTFMTTKISWNEYNRMPHDTFVWKGIDGTKILTHFITTPDPGKLKDNPDSWFYTYNGLMTPQSVKGLYDAYSDKALNNSLLLAYGYGDGGGGVNRDMLESRRKLDKIPGLPHVKTDTANSFFNKLHRTVAATDQYLPEWDGELYLEFHRGTYTSHAYMKKMNRYLELKYRELEFEALLTQLNQSSFKYPQKQINQGWQIILRNQFHDIIPGSAIHEVYEDSQNDYQQALINADQIQAQIDTDLIATKDNIYTVINSAGWKRSSLVTVKQKQKGQFQDLTGEWLPSIQTPQGYRVYVPNIPELGTKQFRFVPAASQKKVQLTATVGKNNVETKFYKLTWNDHGQITSLYDKTAQREVFVAESLNNTLEIYEDKPRDYDAWNIDFDYYLKKQILNAHQIQVVENNELRVVIQLEYVYQSSYIKQNMILYSHNYRVDFETEVNWQERQKLLKAGFWPDVRTTEARYQIQFGNLTRSTTWNTSWDWAKFETVGHQWADLSEQNYGVALLNNCKYGYGIHNNHLTLSLLKGAISPDPQADLGKHSFTYSLLPHKENFVTGKVEENAWELNNPLIAKEGVLNSLEQLLQINSAQTVVIDALKKAEKSNNLILRLHDHTGGRRKITINPLFSCKGVNDVNLLEEKIAELDFPAGKVEFTLKPYEIKTLEFKL